MHEWLEFRQNRELANELFDIEENNDDLIDAMRLSYSNVNNRGTGLLTAAIAFPARRFMSRRFNSVRHMFDWDALQSII